MPKFAPEALDERISEECYSVDHVVVHEEREVPFPQCRRRRSQDLVAFCSQFLVIRQRVGIYEEQDSQLSVPLLRQPRWQRQFLDEQFTLLLEWPEADLAVRALVEGGIFHISAEKPHQRLPEAVFLEFLPLRLSVPLGRQVFAGLHLHWVC